MRYNLLITNILTFILAVFLCHTCHKSPQIITTTKEVPTIHTEIKYKVRDSIRVKTQHRVDTIYTPGPTTIDTVYQPYYISSFSDKFIDITTKTYSDSTDIDYSYTTELKVASTLKTPLLSKPYIETIVLDANPKSTNQVTSHITKLPKPKIALSIGVSATYTDKFRLYPAVSLGYPIIIK